MLHFIAGLPRSGSTLLAALLRQNPRFHHIGLTSPVAGDFMAVERQTAGNVETSVFVSDEHRDRRLRSAFSDAYFDVPKDKDKVTFDTSRFWCSRLPVLARLFPESKVIACVRDLAWVLDSFERLYRRNGMRASSLYGWDVSGTVYSRTIGLASSGGVVGYSLDALREAYYSEERDRLMLVEYEDLCRYPLNVLGDIYEFINQPRFAHDVENVEYSAGEFDGRLGAPGLHDVRGRVEWRPRETILPPDLFHRYDNDQFWRG